MINTALAIDSHGISYLFLRSFFGVIALKFVLVAFQVIHPSFYINALLLLLFCYFVSFSMKWNDRTLMCMFLPISKFCYEIFLGAN